MKHHEGASTQVHRPLVTGRVVDKPWTKKNALLFLTLSALLSCTIPLTVADPSSPSSPDSQHPKPLHQQLPDHQPHPPLKKPIFTAQDSEYNPQQSAGMEQILDPDTYNGAKAGTPDPTYNTKSSKTTSSTFDDPPMPGAIDPDIRDMAGNMTLRQLAGQMTQIQIGMLIGKNGELDMAKVEYWIGEWGVGSFLDTPTNHGGKYIAYSARRFANIVDAIQRVALSNGRKIPIIYGLDSVHGANYVDGAVLFPQQIGLAATFNTSIAYESGRITAKDTRAAGIPWVFGPILDIAVHKLWPRVYETFGEDPHLAAEMGNAIIKGLQGNYKEDRTRVAACMKHFIGYSASRNGQDKGSAWIPDNYLMDYFVPSFQAAVDAGVATAMETYIDINGQPVVGSHFYLTELLRNRIGFEGMLVTDWQELDRLYTEHRSVPSLKQTAEQSLHETTVDMLMVPESEWFSKEAVSLVNEERLTRDRLVESVERVLQLKKDVGLFEQPYSDPDLLSLVGSQQDRNAARDAARESITVLKNVNNVLPLKGSSTNKIVITGPAADSIRALSGGWSIKWQGAEKEEWYQGRGETILDGLEREFGEFAVSLVPSVDFDGNSIEQEKGAYLKEIEHADTVILCLGEKPYAEIVGNIDNLDLPWGQLEVILKVSELVKGTNTKIILVLVEGRPRGLQQWHERVDGIVMAYLPGPWGGRPIAEVLSGRVNPSGRLPMTYPSSAADMATNYYRSGIDAYKPLFPFGAGLSYGSVEYGEIWLNKRKLHTSTRRPKGLYGIKDIGTLEFDRDNEESSELFSGMRLSQDNPRVAGKVEETDDQDDQDDQDPTVPRPSEEQTKAGSSILAKVTVSNTGDVARKETVFWYITQDYRSDIMPEAFLLKGFEKVALDQGESKEVEFRITRKALMYHGRDLSKRVEKGNFTLTVNAMRPEVQSIKFEVV
ncbi:hypothetical protein BGZ93_006739 [Podila epicladia]|nr:hypothetical protein BGZ92_008009 [Podila epicladia]KAG0099628.1 hypothetical protein BGZ93_006739 [Podila epicladia]